MYDTTIRPASQDELHDIDKRGQEKPWAEHKREAQVLAMAYDLAAAPEKAARVRACADSLGFYRTEEGRLKLKMANFCRVRLCPICQWRRALKIYGQARQIVDFLATQRHGGYAYIMLTLTTPNVPGDQLPKGIDDLHRGWQRLMQRKQVKAAVKGWMRATEVTCSNKEGTFHHHIHSILAVLPSYFTGRTYIPHDQWLNLWQDAMRNQTITQVDVRRAYGDMEKAVAEIAKYTAKPGQYIAPDDLDAMTEKVLTLDAAMAGRRCVSWGGCMADAHKALELDDAEDGDLLDIGISEEEAEEKMLIWDWAAGRKNYLKRKKIDENA